jgi:hypothetical protein
MTRMNWLLSTLLTGVATVLLGGTPGVAAEAGVKFTQQEDRVRIEINGELFTDYIFKGTNHVYYYPLIGPGGLPMTRNYPMKTDVPGEEHDHQHHRSLWYSHGAVNGVDFWSETPKAGRILHDKFLEMKSGPDQGVLRSANRWVAPDGKVICTDERVLRVFARPAQERVFDFEITLRAPSDRDVLLGDTKEGTMAVRLAETMRLTRGKQQAGLGRIVLSTGLRDDRTWGQRAAWCDYHGPVEGKLIGVAIFDHPSNPAHPTWWHVRDYGLFAANPFGVHDFEKKPAGAGNLNIPAGQSVTFKYRFYLHEGDERQAKVAERYQEYAK